MARVLAEVQDALDLGKRHIGVANVVFVGSPNGGTPMAVGRDLRHFFDTYTNLLCPLPTMLGVDQLAVVLEALKYVATAGMGGLRGLQSMTPGGRFGQRLAHRGAAPQTRYFAVASDYRPTDRTLSRLMTSQLRGLFDGPHDFVVPVESVYGQNGSASFPIKDRVVFSEGKAMSR